MRGMNQSIRETVKATLREQNLTQTQVAEILKMPRPQVTRMLSGQSGTIPEGWQRMLDALGLELVAVKKEA